MPMTVPQYGEARVAPNSLPTPRLIATAMPDIAGQQISQQGAQMLKIGQAMLDQANTVRTDRALNDLKEEELRLTFDPEAGFSRLKGAAALSRPDNRPLEDEYGEALSKRAEALRASLGNDAQRQAFDRAAGGMMTAFRGRVMAHRNQAFIQDAVSVSQGVIETAARDVALNYRDPEAMEGALARIAAQTDALRRITGKSASEFDPAVRGAASGALRMAAQTAIDEGDLSRAQQILAEFGDRMTAGDVLSARKTLDHNTSLKRGSEAAEIALGMARQAVFADDFQLMREITEKKESLGRQLRADGQPVTSRAGAIGIMQVMPETGKEIARRMGVPWDEARFRNDPVYNAMLGANELEYDIQHYRGDAAKAWAAYNAGRGGPGNPDRGVWQAEQKAKAAGHPDAWLQYLPAETREYVTSNMAALGKAQTARRRMPTMEEIYSALDRMTAGDPVARKDARAQVAFGLNVMERDRKQREDEAVSAAMQAIVDNGGNVNRVPPAILEAVPPGARDDLYRFAESIFRGQDKTDMSAWLAFTNLPKSEMAAMTPEALWRQYRGRLSEADFRRANEMMIAAREKDAASSKAGLQVLSQEERMTNAARELGILPGDVKLADADQKLDYAHFREAVQKAVVAFEAINGRKATVEDLQGILDAEKLRRVNVRQKWWFDRKGVAVQALDAEELGDAYVDVTWMDHGKQRKRKVFLNEISDEYRVFAINLLRREGRVVTEAAIAEIWINDDNRYLRPGQRPIPE